MIEDARRPGCGRKLLEYVRGCKTIDAEPAAAIDAPIVVASNAERCSINRHMALRFAAMRGKVLYSFELANDHGNEETKFLFVEGAPAVVTDNVSQALGLVNGAQCLLHHLAFNDPSDALHAAAAAHPGSEVVVPKPAAIFVTLRNDPTGTPYPMCLSGFKTRTDLAKDVEFVTFQCDLAFSFTFHKIQGVSVDNLVLDLNKRPKKLGVIRHGHVYVALTRVRSAAGLFVLPERNGGFEHLKGKEPSEQLLNWLDYLLDRDAGDATISVDAPPPPPSEAPRTKDVHQDAPQTDGSAGTESGTEADDNSQGEARAPWGENLDSD